VPHSDDCSIFAGGTLSKLISEGYAGYLIRLTNDDADSFELTPGQTFASAESECAQSAKILGLERVFDLNYRNHYLDQVPPTELRARLVFLFRALKIDTVFSFDPSAIYDMNPEHRFAAQMVEYSCFLAGSRLDYPEHFVAGLSPQRILEKYYWARGQQLANRVVDISQTIATKIEAIAANKTQIGNMVRSLKSDLRRSGQVIPMLEVDDETAIRRYADAIFGGYARKIGEQYGIGHGERFRHVGKYYWPEMLEEFVAQNATVDKTR
jgi:LmbE family N-acetylglucosaminyl deacetylase